MAKRKKHPGGRPTAYKPEYAEMAKLVIEDSGFSMYKLAKLFKVDRATIYRWMEIHKEFCDGVENGRRTYEGLKIHQSLVKKAVGFTYTETTKEPITLITKDPTTGETKRETRLGVTKKVKKYYPPDVAAIKHWQVNRDPANWRDKQDLDVTDLRMAQAILDSLPTDVAERVKASIRAKLGKK